MLVVNRTRERATKVERTMQSRCVCVRERPDEMHQQATNSNISLFLSETSAVLYKIIAATFFHQHPLNLTWKSHHCWLDNGTTQTLLRWLFPFPLIVRRNLNLNKLSETHHSHSLIKLRHTHAWRFLEDATLMLSITGWLCLIEFATVGPCRVLLHLPMSSLSTKGLLTDSKAKRFSFRWHYS